MKRLSRSYFHWAQLHLFEISCFRFLTKPVIYTPPALAQGRSMNIVKLAGVTHVSTSDFIISPGMHE